MTNELKDLFARALADETPGRVDLHRVVQAGRKREYARRGAVVAGVGAVAAATATVATITFPAQHRSGRPTVLQPAGQPSSSPAVLPGQSLAASPSPSVPVAGAEPSSVASPDPSSSMRGPVPSSTVAASVGSGTPPSTDPACKNVDAGSSPIGNSAAIPTSADVSAAVRASAPAYTFKVIDSGPIMELSQVGYATLELMGSVADAKGPTGIQVQAAAEGVVAASAADAAVLAGNCNGRTYSRSALAGGGVLLAENTRPVNADGYEVVAYTAKGVRIRASAQPWVFDAVGGPKAGSHDIPLLTVAQLEQIVRTLAAG